MNMIKLSKVRKTRRKHSIRNKIAGTADRPRLSVFKSNKYISIQVIDDDKQSTITSASSIKMSLPLNIETSKKVGEEVAKKLKENKIAEVVFDRNGYLYTGKIKALADAVRAGGIKF